uniref:Carbohydrate kinase FGGY C-terminal domain-containing protein n=1 Tax=Pseudo-nitzschia australis TaxID=44445 RepID=A0A7S4EGK4_9STRA
MKHHAEDNTAKDTTTKEHSSSSYDASTISIILAIDVGSSSVRCTAYDYSTTRDRNRNGNANTNTKIVTVPIHGCSLSIQRPGVEPISGAIRTNDLLDAVDCSVDEVLSKLGAKFKDQQKEFRIEAVGFSTFVMNLVAVDDTGELIVFGGNDGDDHNDENDTNPNCDDAMIIHHPAPTTSVSISYACNASEVNEECQRLRQELGQELVDALYQATGAPLHSAYALPQLRVLYKNLNPTNRQRNRKIHKWQSVAGYCLAQWTGKPHLPISYSEASWMGLLNVCDCTYEELAIGLLPPECRDALPELADFTDHLCGIPQFITEKNESGGRTNPYWEKWPELRNTKFFLGIGDGACANVGSKCTTSYRIAVTIGTSAAARMCLRQEAPSSSSSSSSFFSIPKCRGLFCYRVDRNHVLIGGALTDGGSIVEWASRFLNLDKDKRAFQKCLEETKGLVKAEYEYEMRTTKQQLTHRDLIMAPFLSGERSTGFRDGAAGAIFGLTRETTPAHFFKASLEAVSLRLKAVLDLLLLTGQDGNKRITTCGKGGNREDYAPESTTTENPIAARLPLVVASGKAMEVNHLWRQMIADSSGLSVVLDEDTAEGTSRGVARLVAMSLLAETKAASPGETTNASGTKPSSDCDNETTALKTTVESQKKPQSLVYAQYEEELNLYVISKPRPTATAMYARKSRVQEGFIDSISPFFAST